ncbi:MAG: hypothetical protein RI530_02455 [Microbacteriaceae bacterium]|nr:hypothetical protein [Microbacteriaceae bacterium]
MLVEIIFTCSATQAVLGGCANDCGTTVGASEVAICEQQRTETGSNEGKSSTTPGSTWTPPPPWVLCEVYVSGGVEIPTFGTVWVKSRQGERECLSEKEYIPIPKPDSSSKSVEGINDSQTLQQIFKTSPTTPMAYVSPSERYYDEQFSFWVEKTTQIKSGTLFGEAVSVRFTPKSASWSFGGSGFSVAHIFGEKGDFQARAIVNFQVDYKPIGGSWVIDAGSIQIPSNSLLVTALALPRETRLIG